MIIVDAHCDTVTKIKDTNENLLCNSCHLDIKRMKSAGSYVQFFAAFVKPVYAQSDAIKWILSVIGTLYNQIEMYNDHITLCCNYSDIIKTVSCGKTAAILTIEDGAALQGDISVLHCYYRLGVRSICITWNNRNLLADGAGEFKTKGGLTLLGKKVVREMNSLGMLVDTSHISEAGFWDIAECANAPFIASHSNAREICNHRRNLYNTQIAAIQKSGGVIGINLFPEFLNNTLNANINDVIKHIEHICSVSDADSVGLGSDFDGIDYTPAGIAGVQDIYKIFNELLKLNYRQEDVEKIAGGNFLRVIKQVLG